MTDVDELGEIPLPDDIKSLDAELSSIAYEERPSFGPELRAELAEAWSSRPARRPLPWRYLAAAGIAGLLFAGAAVPSARAALVILIGAISPGGRAPAEEPVVAEPPLPAPVVVAMTEPELPEPESPEPEPEPERALVPDVAPASPPVLPRMLDRARAQALLEDAYPPHLQRAGIGGELWLRVWIDANGMTSMASVVRGSGVTELDEAALEVAPLLRFEPAVQNGGPVATWIQFPVRFEPDAAVGRPGEAPSDAVDPFTLPSVPPGEEWSYDRPLDPSDLPRWTEEPSSTLTEAEAALVDAIGDPMVRRSLGPIESILAGVAPANRAPLEWRESARLVLEEALRNAPDNPAPLLALGRIRIRQGLRTDARMLFERGLQMAIQSEASVPSSLVAELHFERAGLIRENWLASRAVGRVHSYAFDEAPCPQARTSTRSTSGFASVERLIAWNYLCPQAAQRVFRIGFEPTDPAIADLSLMMASFRAAIDVDPGHVGSNVGLLVMLAEEERWEDVLAGARRFARRSGGHPKALLLAGLALQRLGRTGDAAAFFEEGLARLPVADADQLRDPTFVLDPADVAKYRRLSGAERRAWERAYWDARDRTSSEVNEREIEHLARTSYAWLRFGSAASDPAEVWVRFGGPNTVHIVDEGAGQLTEFWDYGSGPDITFVRWVASQTMDLTPEGRAYVDDLGKIFPPE